MGLLSPYLFAVLVAWIAAQGLKYVRAAILHRDLRTLRHLYLSGNMPSAHSATVVALLVLIGFRDGIDSGLFGLAALISSIVMYDAMMVRRSSGEQGEAIQALIKEQGSQVRLPRAAKGHTPVEVAVGALLGALIGSVVFLSTR